MLQNQQPKLLMFKLEAESINTYNSQSFESEVKINGATGMNIIMIILILIQKIAAITCNKDNLK